MICRTFFLCFLAFSPGLILSQNHWYHYDQVNYSHKDYEKMTDEAYQFSLEKYKHSKYVEGNYKQYALESALYLYEDLDHGKIYMSLQKKEVYIRKVLNLMVGDTALTNNIKIFFYRDGSLNASMSESGLIRLNVGTLARLRNEAELAMLLGHELGHFLNEDDVKRYARDKQSSPWSGDWSMKWKGGGMVLTVSTNYWYSREQEEAADLVSVKFLKNSPYSLEWASEIYRSFKREEIRTELKYGKETEHARSHPYSGDRLKMVRGFVDSTDTRKKNFAVDSVEFMKLKELCFMETINIGFSSNDLDEIMTLTFSRYLVEPENDYNLAVLIEALRRYIVLNEQTKNYDKPFMLYPYQTKNKEALANYSFLKEEKPSILNYLLKGFVDIWKEDQNSIKTVDLINQEVTEFTTYLEAYDYFKQKARERKCKIAEHYKYFGPQAESADVESYKEINDLFLSNDYLGRTQNTLQNQTAVILFPISTYSLLKKFPQDSIRQRRDGFNSAISIQMKSLQNSKALVLNDLSFNDQHLVRSLVGLCDSELNMQKGHTCHSKMNWAEVQPETYSLFQKYNFSELYICLPYTISDAQGKNPRVVVCYYRISAVGPSKDVAGMTGKKMEWNAAILENEQTFSAKMSNELGSFMKTSN